MNIKKSILLRVRIAFLVILIFALSVSFKILHLQYAEGEKWQKMHTDIVLQEKKVKATRGNIYAEDGSLLATSLPFYKVAFDPTIASEPLFNSKIDSLAHLLAGYFNQKSSQEYKREIKRARLNNKQYLVLSNRQINHLEKKELSEWPIFRQGRLYGGVIFEKVDKRFKPFSHLGSRTIGFVNSNNNGAGLEYSFDEVLSGKDGKGVFQKMAGGNWKPVFDGSEVRTQKGKDIETTLDINLQDVTESALLGALQDHDGDYGCAVVMEVETGEIKAMANLSKNSAGKYWERYNYAVGNQGLTEPGSTFKLASVIALFEDSNLNIHDSVNTGNGEYLFYDRNMRDHKPGGFGKITIEKAFTHSSNIGISKLIDHHFGLKPKRYTDYIRNMGLADPLGFQIEGEGTPFIKTPEDPSWSGTTLPWMSIGYELKLTPLQTLTFYNAIANDGKMIQPIIVKNIRKADHINKTFEPAVLNEAVCSEETLEKVQKLLKGVVERGTANNIKDKHLDIAGKTGTAKKYEDGNYTKEYYTSFVGYFPADDPKYSCIVVIDSPKGFRQYGGNVAAPVFKTIADKIYSTDIKLHEPLPEDFEREKGVFPVIRAGQRNDLALISNQLGIGHHGAKDVSWVRAQRDGNQVKWQQNTTNNKENSVTIVPDVRGMTLRDALYLLENKGLQVIHKGNGRVARQSQQPGTKALQGSRIYLNLD